MEIAFFVLGKQSVCQRGSLPYELLISFLLNRVLSSICGGYSRNHKRGLVQGGGCGVFGGFKLVLAPKMRRG